MVVGTRESLRCPCCGKWSWPDRLGLFDGVYDPEQAPQHRVEAAFFRYEGRGRISVEPAALTPAGALALLAALEAAHERVAAAIREQDDGLLVGVGDGES